MMKAIATASPTVSPTMRPIGGLLLLPMVTFCDVVVVIPEVTELIDEEVDERKLVVTADVSVMICLSDEMPCDADVACSLVETAYDTFIKEVPVIADDDEVPLATLANVEVLVVGEDESLAVTAEVRTLD